MSFTDDLLVLLSSYHGGYRLMRRRMRGDDRDYDRKTPRSFDDTSEGVFRVTLSRLKKRGLVRNERGAWLITTNGLAYLKRKFSRRPHLRAGPKNMIVAFDIPEKLKSARNWLRGELRILGFVLLQRSVWYGPAPLPKDFITAVREQKILSYLKFFKAEEAEIV